MINGKDEHFNTIFDRVFFRAETWKICMGPPYSRRKTGDIQKNEWRCQPLI